MVLPSENLHCAEAGGLGRLDLSSFLPISIWPSERVHVASANAREVRTKRFMNSLLGCSRTKVSTTCFDNVSSRLDEAGQEKVITVSRRHCWGNGAANAVDTINPCPSTTKSGKSWSATKS